jgi:hypothetical protein
MDSTEKKKIDNFNNAYVKEVKEDVRSYNIGTSDYSKHEIQPWSIWKEYHLNPWDADIVKRVLRNKEVEGMTPEEARKMFKRIYPETFVKIVRLEQVEERYIIQATFPDGNYWFIVDDCSVSNSYDSYSDARRNL